MDVGLVSVARAEGFGLEELKPGMAAETARTVTETDIVMFAGISGDVNPAHMDQEFAATSRFKGRIAHGMLLAGYISAVLGNKLPGPGCIYVGQTLRFRAPVRAGDTVRTRVTVKEVLAEKRRVILLTECMVGGTVVVDGEATLMVEPSAA